MSLAHAQPNCYDVCVSHTALKRALIQLGRLRQDGDRLLVTFKGAHLPDCKLLALHALCARVAHPSGAARAIDEWEQDVEET